MFSDIHEAYNSGLKKQINEIEEKNNKNKYRQMMVSSVEDYQHNNNLTSPYQNIPFINAQGDLADRIDYQGTKISDLKSELGSEDSLFEEDSLTLNSENNDYSADSLSFSSNDFKKDFSHSCEYCINKYVQEFSKDDLLSIGSDYNDVFEHVSGCKYCRNEVAKKLKAKFSENKKDKIDNKKEENEINNFTDNLKSDIKEIVIVIVVGLVIIFLLDLFYRIGKKLS
tara:strand:- start:3559 stop:4236 length:678 start_codon:yes stop_codon:yes gene_type:complete